MKALIVSNKDYIKDLFENEILAIFQTDNISKETDLNSFSKYENYNLCVIDIDSSLSSKDFNIFNYFSENKKKIIESNTILIFVSENDLYLNPFRHPSFSNIYTFKPGKRTQNNLSRMERFFKQDLSSTVVLKKFIKKIKLCVFVHGFSGSEETWANLDTLIKNDSDLKQITTKTFNYESFDFDRKRFKEKLKIRKYTNVRGLAKSLENFIKNNQYDELFLVGHSLGCLIIKKFLLLNYKYTWSINPKKVILFAPPNKGSRLANLLLFYSITNPHVQYLSLISIKRRIDNFSWWKNKIKNKFAIKVIIGESDKTVRVKSATFGFDDSSLIHIHDTNHIDIKQPGSIDSEIYKTFKSIINN